MPEEINASAKKTIRDFSDEEKKAMVERAKRLEVSRVAKEFDTSWQVVAALVRAENKKAKASKAAKTARAARSKVKTKRAAKAAAAPKTVQKATRTRTGLSETERSAILARAAEIGVTDAAKEVGISKWTIFQWRKNMKKAGLEVPGVPSKGRKRRAAKVKTVDVKQEETAAEKAVKGVRASITARALKEPKAPKVSGKKSALPGSLEFENALLKEQVAVLQKQIAKLRAAVAELA